MEFYIFLGGFAYILSMQAMIRLLYYVIFAAMLCYMPTISLSNSVAYNILKQFRYCKSIPPEFGYDRFYCCNVVNELN
jgi:NHS family xanthosine MFS transporter